VNWGCDWHTAIGYGTALVKYDRGWIGASIRLSGIRASRHLNDVRRHLDYLQTAQIKLLVNLLLQVTADWGYPLPCKIADPKVPSGLTL
jgi:hypothetical protein